MPLQETFWSPAYGQVKDKFNIEWQVTTSTTEQKFLEKHRFNRNGAFYTNEFRRLKGKGG